MIDSISFLVKMKESIILWSSYFTRSRINIRHSYKMHMHKSDSIIGTDYQCGPLIDFFLFLFRFLVEFDEFYRIKKLSMDGEHHYS